MHRRALRLRKPGFEGCVSCDDKRFELVDKERELGDMRFLFVFLRVFGVFVRFLWLLLYIYYFFWRPRSLKVTVGPRSDSFKSLAREPFAKSSGFVCLNFHILSVLQQRFPKYIYVCSGATVASALLCVFYQ